MLDVHAGNAGENTHHGQHVQGGRKDATETLDLALEGGGGVEEDLRGVTEEKGEGEGGPQGTGEPITLGEEVPMVVFEEYAGAATGEKERICGAHEGAELLGTAGEEEGVFRQKERGFAKNGNAV